MSERNAKSSRSRSLNKTESVAEKKQRNTSPVNESMDESKAKTKSGAKAGGKADNNQVNKNGKPAEEQQEQKPRSGAASKKPAEIEKKAPAEQKEYTGRVTRSKTYEQPFVLRRSARNINRAKAAAAKIESGAMPAKAAQPQPFFTKSAGKAKAKAKAQAEQNAETQGASKFISTITPYPSGLSTFPRVDHSMPQTGPTRFIQTRQRTAAAMNAKSLGGGSGPSTRASTRASNKTVLDKAEVIEEKTHNDSKGSKTLSNQSSDTKAALSEASKSTKADKKKQASASDGGKQESASNHKEHEKDAKDVDKKKRSSQAVVADAPSSSKKHAPISSTKATHDARKEHKTDEKQKHADKQDKARVDKHKKDQKPIDDKQQINSDSNKDKAKSTLKKDSENKQNDCTKSIKSAESTNQIGLVNVKKISADKKEKGKSDESDRHVSSIPERQHASSRTHEQNDRNKRDESANSLTSTKENIPPRGALMPERQHASSRTHEQNDRNKSDVGPKPLTSAKENIPPRGTPIPEQQHASSRTHEQNDRNKSDVGPKPLTSAKENIPTGIDVFPKDITLQVEELIDIQINRNNIGSDASQQRDVGSASDAHLGASHDVSMPRSILKKTVVETQNPVAGSARSNLSWCYPERIQDPRDNANSQQEVNSQMVYGSSPITKDICNDDDLMKELSKAYKNKLRSSNNMDKPQALIPQQEETTPDQEFQLPSKETENVTQQINSGEEPINGQEELRANKLSSEVHQNVMNTTTIDDQKKIRTSEINTNVQLVDVGCQVDDLIPDFGKDKFILNVERLVNVNELQGENYGFDIIESKNLIQQFGNDEENSNKSTDDLAVKLNYISIEKMQIENRDKTIELEKHVKKTKNLLESKSHHSPGNLPSESFTIDEANLTSFDIDTLQKLEAQLKKQIEMLDSSATESQSEQEDEPDKAVDESVSKIDENVNTSTGIRIGQNYFQYREGSSNDTSVDYDYCPNSETDTNVLTNQQDIDGNKQVNSVEVTSDPPLYVPETAEDKIRLEKIMKLKQFKNFIKESDDVGEEFSNEGTTMYCGREKNYWDAHAKWNKFDNTWQSSINPYSVKPMQPTDRRMKKGMEIKWSYVEHEKVETEIQDNKRNIAIQVNEQERHVDDDGQANNNSFNEPLDGYKDTTFDNLTFPLPDFTELMQMEEQSEKFDVLSCLNELSFMETDCMDETQMLEGQQWLETDEARELLECISGDTSIMPMDQTVDSTQAAQEPTAGIKRKDDSVIQMEKRRKYSAEVQEIIHIPNDPEDRQAVAVNTANEEGQQASIATKEKPQMLKHLEEEDDVDLEEIGVSATFEFYWPYSLSEEQAIKLEHPNEILEMSILMSMHLPKKTYNATPALTERLNNPRRLSDLQLETVTYVGQAHEQILPNGERAGFLLGDGPGVGKTRTLAAIIYENFKNGRIRALWVAAYESVSTDVDREFEFIDQTAHIKVVPIGDFNYDHITLDGEEDEAYLGGVVCASYTNLAGESQKRSAKFKSHVCQLAEWLGPDGVIILDDCHKATSLSLVNRHSFISTCQAVHQLQQLLPLARVVYASDLGASDPRNMVYMTRLGLWGNGTSYPEFLDFVTAMEKRGTDAMQMVAVDLKMRGNYMSRQLSFQKVAYHIEVVFMSQEFCSIYNDSTILWAEISKAMYTCFRRLRIDSRIRERITQHYWVSHHRFFKNLWLAEKVRRVVDLAKEALESEYSIVLGIQSTNESLGEWQYLPQDIINPTGFVSTAKAIILLFMQRYFPAPSKAYVERLTAKGAFDPVKRADPNGYALECLKVDLDISDSDDSSDSLDNCNSSDCSGDDEQTKIKLEEQMIRERDLEKIYNSRREELPTEEFELNFEDVDLLNNDISESALRDCMSAKEQILLKVEELSRRLPLNTVDELIKQLGGRDKVAEITHRNGRILQIDEHEFEYEKRGDTPTARDMVNYAESLSFVDNEKMVAIVSETAAGGLSLHSDLYVTNQRPRIFISLELPWSVDRALRHFGCVARSNQANEPEIIMLISHVETELHQAKALAMELRNRGAFDSLPPLGDPFGRSQSLSTINNGLGASAVNSVLQQIAGIKQLEENHVPSSYLDQFTAGCRAAMVSADLIHAEINDVGERVYVLDTASQHVLTFMNRLLGCQIDMQNAMFKFFFNKMYAMMVEVKRSHQFNLGIMDLNVHFGIVSVSKLVTFRRESPTGTTISELRTMKVKRGISFDKALAKYTKKNRSEHEGFYILQRKRNQRTCVILCLTPTLDDSSETVTELDANLVVIRPNTGAQVHTELLSSLTKRYSKTSIKNAQQFWTAQYEECLTNCSHIFFGCECPYGKSCRLGERVRSYNVLSGQLLNVGVQLAKVIETNERKMQIVRVQIDKERRIMGVLIPDFAYQSVLAELSSDAIVESRG